MRFELPGKPTQVLITGIVLLGLLLVVQLLYPAAPTMGNTGTLSVDDASLPEFGSDALAPPALVDLSDMLDRPLFFNDRRMPEPPEDTAPPPPPKPLRLKLQGVALGSGSRVAVLRNLSSNLLLQMDEGDTHDGWTLEEVTSSSARFSRGAQMTELPLDPATDGRRR